jgi:MSHA biogenesis protein MshJ
MFLLIGSFVPFFLLDQLLLQPTISSQADSVKKVYQIRTQILNLKTSEQEAIIKHAFNPDKDNQRQIDSISTQIVKLDTRLKDFTINFASPGEIPKILNNILSLQEWLQFEGLSHLDPVPLFKPKGDGPGEGQNSNLITEDGNVFIHTFIFEFSGGYLSIINYLERLEKLPWKFFWEAIDIKMENYPNARVILTLQTLSLQKGIMGI